VPAKTPLDIVRKMHTTATAMLGEPAIRTKFDPLGITLAPSSPDELAARLRTETA
jgi:tripartite-type tricarboxylate transporter receptor subunit TctC